MIELLVVIAIIAILAAILFPVFAQARERARGITCVSNLNQIGLATLMYVQDYDETFPSGWKPASSGQSGLTIWRWSLQPYIQKYGSQNPTDLYNSKTFGSMGVFTCPDQPASYQNYGPTSYGYSETQMTTGWTGDNSGATDMNGLSQAAMIQPANLVMYADSAQIACPGLDPNVDDGANNLTDFGPYKFNPDLWTESWSDDWSFSLPGPGGTWKTGGSDWACKGGQGRRPIPRHFHHINCAFVDGHVKAEPGTTLTVQQGTPQDIWTNHN